MPLSYQPVDAQAGESGYFSTPVGSLDPRLFTGGGDVFRPEVRQWTLDTLYQYWGLKYEAPESWSTVWVAGSGISYQWAASRGNGDLDILIGVDFPAFWQANPRFRGLTEEDTAALINQDLHDGLWGKTAHTQVSEGSPPNVLGATDIFEVTWYVNPRATDIRSINPYAAYDLSHNTWTVRPPSGEAFKHPQEYYDAANREDTLAHDIIGKYNQAAQRAAQMSPGTPGHQSAQYTASLAAAQAQSLYEDIHLGRKQAFAPGGSGYGDYYNFRWQFHKRSGTAQTLHAVARAHSDARQAANEQIYGGPIEGADVVLRRAALWNRGMA